MPQVKKDDISRLSLIGKIDNRLISNSLQDFTKGWNTSDLDWWTLLVSQTIDRNTDTIKIPLQQVKDLMLKNRHWHESTKAFVKRSNKSLAKFLQIIVTFEKEQGNKLSLVNTQMFDKSEIDTDLNVVVKIKKEAVPLFNQLSHWTKFALEAYTSLHTTYAKRLYMYLKQWRTQGSVEFKMSDFRKKLMVPKSYRTGSIDQKILTPSLEELAPFFRKLKIIKEYGKTTRGRKVSGYILKFIPEAKDVKDAGQSQKIKEFRAVYNIMSNNFLNFDQKLIAVDRYRGLKLGTTRKYFESAHPQTIFLDIAPDGSKRPSKGSKSHRYNYAFLNKQTIKTLRILAYAYEDLLGKGKLKEWDLMDLDQIETILFVKETDLMVKTRDNEKPYKPAGSLIAEQLIMDVPTPEHITAEQAKKEIKIRIKSRFGRNIPDHRPIELR